MPTLAINPNENEDDFEMTDENLTLLGEKIEDKVKSCSRWAGPVGFRAPYPTPHLLNLAQSS